MNNNGATAGGPSRLMEAAQTYPYMIGRDRCACCMEQLGPNKPGVFVVSPSEGLIKSFCVNCATFTTRGWRPVDAVP